MDKRRKLCRCQQHRPLPIGVLGLAGERTVFFQMTNVFGYNIEMRIWNLPQDITELDTSYNGS